jgi:hypothetical protein
MFKFKINYLIIINNLMSEKKMDINSLRKEQKKRLEKMKKDQKKEEKSVSTITDKEKKIKQTKLFVPNVASTQLKHNEENLIRIFLTNILKLRDINKIAIGIYKYQQKSSTSYIHKKHLKDLLDKLPTSYVIPFIEEFLFQDKKTFDSFFNTYINRNEIKEIINKQTEDSDIIYEENQLKLLNKNIEKELFGSEDDEDEDEEDEEKVEVEEEEEVVEEPEEEHKINNKMIIKQRKQTIFLNDLDIQQKPTIQPTKITNDVIVFGNKNCKLDLIWLGEPIESIWIFSNKSNLNNFKNNKINPLKYNGKIWYMTNSHFLNLLCEKIRTQVGDNIHINNDFGNEMIIQLMYKVKGKDKYILHDSILAKKEKNYLYSKRESQIDSTLNDNVDKFTKEIANIELTSVFYKFVEEPTTYDRYGSIEISAKVDDSYIKNIIFAISQDTKNNREFAEKLFNIIVYIKPISSDFNNNFFRKRLKEKYYMPDFLLHLSNSDKLPEIFDNPDISEETKNKIASIINTNIKTSIDNFAYSIYRIKNKNIVIKEKRYDSILIEDNLSSSKKIINNKLIENNDELIEYTEGDTLYYFPISDLIENFKNGNYINSYNEKPFSNEFIYDFEKTYLESSKKIPSTSISISTPLELPKIKPLIKPIAPGLLDILKDEITRMESELEIDAELHKLESDSEKEAESMSEEESESEKEAESESGSESDNPKFSFIDDKTTKKRKKSNKNIINYNQTFPIQMIPIPTNIQQPNNIQQSNNIQHSNNNENQIIDILKNENKKCKNRKCKNKNLKLKTIIYKNNKPVIVNFCSFKCFEDYKFPKV